MNDAPFDVAPEGSVVNCVVPIKRKAIPMHGVIAYLDHSWSDKLTSAIGYYELVNENTNLRTPDTYRKDRYASVNLLYSPVKNFMTGGEFQYGRRFNLSSESNPNDYRVQCSFKDSWAFKVFGGKS